MSSVHEFACGVSKIVGGVLVDAMSPTVVLSASLAVTALANLVPLVTGEFARARRGLWICVKRRCSFASRAHWSVGPQRFLSGVWLGSSE
jgi:hypothetical protein